MPQVSVVIPSYNHARFVREAIESVAAQTHGDIELIVVDDGSSDGSPELIRESLAGSSLPRSVLIEQSNAGAHAAIDRGVAESSNEIVAILNSDDRFAPERIARLLEEVPAQGDFLIFSKARMIDAAGLEHRPRSATVVGYRHGLYEASRCPTVGFALLRNNIAVSSGNLLFSKGLYRKLSGFADFELASDWDFLLRALQHVEPIFVSDELLDYRTHGSNTRLGISVRSVNDEGHEILNRYFAAVAEQPPANPLAPCEANWPVYFDLFVSRYHAWFGSGPIRDWMDAPPEAVSTDTSIARWRSWSGAVDFERVDDCDYLAEDVGDPAARAALALAREVLVSSSHPLPSEEGPGEAALVDVFERQRPGRPRFVRFPWRSGLDRGVAPSRDAREASRLRVAAARARARASAVTHSIAPRRWLRWLRESAELRRSGLFDAEHYRSQGARGAALLLRLHYLRVGAAEGLDPHPLFDSDFYLLANPDVAAHGANPLLHYLRAGGREGRAPAPLFDSAYYLRTHFDVQRSGWNPLVHYVRHGEREGRDTHPRFDARFYASQYADQLDADELPLAHYLRAGRELGLAINPLQRMRLLLEGAPGYDDSRAREEGLIRSIRASGFFDDDYYRGSCGVGFDESKFSDPLRHYLERGSVEGVPFCSEEKLAKKIAALDVQEASHPALAYLGRGEPRPVSQRVVAIHVSSRGNSFFNEIAALLAHAFREVGARVHLLDERDAPPAEVDCDVIVAPHEFFLLGAGPERLDPAFLSRSTLWLAEQPGSKYFSICLWFARRSRAVLDINPRTALLWDALGFRARAVPLGHIDGFDAYADRQPIGDGPVRAGQTPAVRDYCGGVDDPWSDRPLDVFCNAVLTERRDRFLARHAGFFSSLRCALFMPSERRPVSAGMESALGATDATAFGQRAKIQLNVHRRELPYFEWHRIVVRGIWQKSVVVTEPSLHVPGLVPNEHYVECELDEIPHKLHHLLNTPAGRAEAEAMRKRAFEALLERYPMRHIAAAFLEEEATWQQA